MSLVTNKFKFNICFLSLLLLLHNGSLASPVNEDHRLEVNGGELFIEISGDDDSAPLLLFLHGGPGNVALGLVGFQVNVGIELEKHFVVAYLHQRGGGHSVPFDTSELTTANFVSDVDRVITFLLEEYGKEKIHLAGHSWGGMLAGLYLDSHPDKVDRLVLIAAPMNSKATLIDSLDFTLDWARENGMQDAVSSLEKVDRTFDELADRRPLNYWADKAYGGLMRNIDIQTFIVENRIMELFPNWQQQQQTTGMAMAEELMNFNLDQEFIGFTHPVLLIAGVEDSIVPPKSMQRLYDIYGGEKKIILLEKSHHLPFFEEPELVSTEIIDFLMDEE